MFIAVVGILINLWRKADQKTLRLALDKMEIA